MEIKVDPEAVNKVVAEAIIKSALGSRLEASIKQALDNVIDGYNSPVKEMVNHFVRDCIKTALQQDYRDKILAAVAERLSTEAVETIVDASVKKALDLLNGDRY